MTLLKITRSSPDDTKALSKLARAVESFGPKAEARVKRAVEKERGQHAYQNRSGDLERDTVFAIVSDGPDELLFEARQDSAYGEFVERRGYSQFGKLVEEAADEIDGLFSSLE